MASMITEFFKIQNQFKVLHWQTRSYSRHKAYGKVYDSLSDLTDTFIEVYMGKYGRVRFDGDGESVELKNSDSMSVAEFLDSTIEFLLGLTEDMDDKADTDLLNIRDEMLAQINRLKYLLTLK
jgi:hypothetical protein